MMWLVGRLSDRFGRKVVIYVSCTLQMIPVLLFTFVHDFTVNVFMGVIFGLGYGTLAGDVFVRRSCAMGLSVSLAVVLASDTQMSTAVFGDWIGAYAAVEWSLASDTLPSVKDHARDMALWHIALSVPQGTDHGMRCLDRPRC